MASTSANILVFDSGVGGISIVSHIQQLIPDANLSYLADNALFPYGMLNDQTLIKRVCLLIQHSLAITQPDLIVIACNSASTLVLPALRQQLDIPIVGVVPAIKPAALQSQSKVIGLLATPGTIKRDYTDELIGEFARDCQIIRVGSSELVTLVEAMIAGHPPDISQLEAVLQPFNKHPQGELLDTVVLACTHFPLIREPLAAAAPAIRYWVDSGEAIARRVQSLLLQSVASPKPHRPPIALFTDTAKINQAVATYFASYGLGNIQQLELTSQAC